MILRLSSFPSGKTILHISLWNSLAYFAHFVRALTDRLTVEIVTLGYVYPNAGASLAYQGPALQMGTEELNKLYHNVMDVRHTWLVDKSLRNCPALADESDNMLSKWYYQRISAANVTALISTTCGEAVNVNRLAANWNILFISTAGVDPVIKDPRKSPTWITAAHNSVSSYTRLYVNLLRRFGWFTIFVVLDDGSVPVYTSLKESLQSAAASMTDQDSNVPKLKLTIRNIPPKSVVNYRNLLDDFRNVSRVMLFFGNAATLRQLMIQAAIAGLTTGDFVYITVEPFAFSLFGNLTWEYNDNFDEVARYAFQSLLVLQPLDDHMLTADMIRDLAPEFLNRSRRDYNFSTTLSEMNGPGMTSSFAGVALLGQVLNETITENPTFPIHDGAALKNLFLNRTFETDVGDLYIDRHGERAINLSVAFFNEHTSRTIFLSQLAGQDQVTPIRDIEWLPGGWPPANEPRCGFTGNSSNCAPQATNFLLVPYVCIAGVTATTAITAACLFINRVLRVRAMYRNPEIWMLDRNWLRLRRNFVSFMSFQSSVSEIKYVSLKDMKAHFVLM